MKNGICVQFITTVSASFFLRMRTHRTLPLLPPMGENSPLTSPVWAFPVGCSSLWACSREQWKDMLGYQRIIKVGKCLQDTMVLIYYTLTCLPGYYFVQFSLCRQDDSYSVLFFCSPCIAEVTSGNNYGSHVSVGWKGSWNTTRYNLPVSEGLSVTLELVFLGFVWCNFFKTSRMEIT